VKIAARVPDADPEKDARAGTNIKSISFFLSRMAFEGLTGRAIVLTSFTSIAVAELAGTSSAAQ
jgi:hypothetical protein